MSGYFQHKEVDGANLVLRPTFRAPYGCRERPPMPRTALITGITGQDGSYLAEFLLSQGYDVHGIVRRTAIEDPQHRLWRLKDILDRISLHAGSMESFASLFRVVDEVKPDELSDVIASDASNVEESCGQSASSEAGDRAD